MEDSQALTQFQQNPGRYLQSVRDSPPSAAAAARLAHSVATAFKNNDTDTTSNATTNSLTASLYLQAAVKQLPAVRSTAAVAGGNAPDAQMKRSQIVTHIVEAVGHAVTQCQPRSLIVQSGILPVLANMLPPATVPATAQSSNNTSHSKAPEETLTVVHVEFLQACIYAGHYAYAEKQVGSPTMWPRPTSAVTVVHVLRYFYLRGIVHWHCNHGDLAVRCWRTCLCIPADAVSAIALAAWKKLVLVQTLRQAHLVDSDPLALPQPVPSVLAKYLQSAATATVRDDSVLSAQPTTAAGAASTTSRNENNMQPPVPEDVVHLVDTLETMGATTMTQQQRQSPSEVVAAYAELVSACVGGINAAQAQAVVQRHTAVLVQDGNLGLAQQVAATVPWIRRIMAESRVYSVIGVQELATIVGGGAITLDDVHRLLTHLATTYTWSIEVSPLGWVSFPAFPVTTTGKDDSPSQLTLELMALQRTVQKMDATLSASNKFRSLSNNATSGGGSKESSGKGVASGPRGVEDV